MPFWWRRRKKNWYGKRWLFRRRNKRRRIYRRRRARPAYRTRRKRRRRRRKVRRKKQTIPVRQWQPDSIRKCKIKGFGIMVLGAEGTQMDCFTQQKELYVPPKVPWGGGFGVENITLEYLYEENKFKNNIWTASNIAKDLVRYLGCAVEFFRHPETDFIVSYNRQPPHKIDKFTYPQTHPQMQLLEKHHRVVLSKATKTNSKLRVRMKIKPPKQMLTKWFFTKPFCTASLVVLRAAAANMRYSHLTGKNQNLQLTIYSLNLAYYQIPNWADASQGGASNKGYWPYATIQFPVSYTYISSGVTQTGNIPIDVKTDYLKSVNYNTGFFKSQFLLATSVIKGTTKLAVHQAIAVRYNPLIDDGDGNRVYLVSTFQTSWGNISDKQFLIEGLPLWLSLFGYYSFILTMKPPDYLKAHVVVLESKALYCYPEIGSCTKYCPIDYKYMQGKLPYDQTITEKQKALWYPDMHWQKQTLNSIVESGPFIPQYTDETYSTWELKYKYLFYFKWGGPNYPDEPIKDPKDLDTYDVPDTMPKTVQIVNPIKQSTESILHPWDWRRGLIKEKAFKRMLENLETDTEYELSAEETPKKKRRGAALRNPEEETQEIESCLQTLCKKNICQDSQENLQNLIQQQQQQQQELKYSILKLIFDLKEKQRMLQYHTGLLE
nr:MAG: ORF1 [Torque teno midi virus]